MLAQRLKRNRTTGSDLFLSMEVSHVRHAEWGKWRNEKPKSWIAREIHKKNILMIKWCPLFLHAQLYHFEPVYACIVRNKWSRNPTSNFGDTKVLISQTSCNKNSLLGLFFRLAQGTDKGDNIKLWMPPNSHCKRCEIQDKGKSQHQ